MFKCLRVLLSALLILALFVGCAHETPTPEDPEETWYLVEAEPETAGVQTDAAPLPAEFSLPYAPDQSLDPNLCPDGMQWVVSSLLYEGLFRLDRAFAPQPLLCSQYRYADEGRIFTFTLREDVCFSDGSPLTAADAAASLQRSMRSDRYGARLSAIETISASDPLTLVITLRTANTALPALLDVPITKIAEDSAVPLGTGFYRYCEEDGVPCLLANAYRQSNAPLPTERIALAEADDQDSMLYRFNSRDIHLILTDLTGSAPIQLSGSIRYTDADTTVFQYLGVNLTRPALADPLLRRALDLGINRNDLAEGYLSGHARAAQFPLSPASALYPNALARRYSVSDFSDAMSYVDALPEAPLTLLVNEENPFKCGIARALSASFTDLGIPMEAVILPWEDYLSALETGDFDLYYGEVKLTADWDLSALLSSGGALNYGGWASAETDRLLSALASAEDRTAAMESLCRHLRAECPILPLCFKSVSVLTRPEVIEGLSPTAAEPFYDLPALTVHLAGD